MKGSSIANQIDAEYRRKQAFSKITRQKCKEKGCEQCKFNRICTEYKEEQNSIK